jgi:ABC-type Zn uptake system ZnuABC Zn-binding protein ZnuA
VGADLGPGKLRVLASTFPMLLFTKNITAGAEGVRVEVMVDPSLGCPHDYALTPADMNKISKADVFIANGLGLEEFLGEPLRQANPKIIVVDSSSEIEEVLRLSSDDHQHTHHDKNQPAAEAPHDDRVGVNPHLFSSPRMAARIVPVIAKALAQVDPHNGHLYEENGRAYAARLQEISFGMVSAAGGLKAKRIVTQHAVFDYLARDLGLEIMAVVEEHPGQEPSAGEMLKIVRTIRKTGAAAVFTEPQYRARVGEVIAKEADIPVAILDPVATGSEEAPLDYYEQTMIKNLETLIRTLGYAD